MKSFIAALRNLILPFGATTGARIVLNGVNGGIQIYNSSNVLVIDISPNGIHIQGPARQWDINASAGFLARRSPDDGTQGQILDAGFFMRPQTPEPNTGATVGTVGQIFAANNFPFGGSSAPYVNVVSPVYTGKPGNSSLTLQGQSQASGVNNSLATVISNEIDLVAGTIIKLNAPTVLPATDFTLQDNQNHYYLAGENQLFNLGILSTDASVTVAIAFTHTFTRAPMVACNINDTAGATGKWTARAINITTTGFTFWVQSPTGTAAGSAVTLKCTWVATEYTP